MKDNFPGFVSQGCFSLDPGDVSERVASNTIVLLNVFMGKRILLLDNKSVIMITNCNNICILLFS